MREDAFFLTSLFDAASRVFRWRDAHHGSEVALNIVTLIHILDDRLSLKTKTVSAFETIRGKS